VAVPIIYILAIDRPGKKREKEGKDDREERKGNGIAPRIDDLSSAMRLDVFLSVFFSVGTIHHI